MDTATTNAVHAAPWNKGKLVGQKPPLKLKEIWAIRIRLQLDHRARELALFNLAIDSKLRGCDLVGLRVHEVVQGSHVAARAIVMQKKTQRPVQFEITEQTREAVTAWSGCPAACEWQRQGVTARLNEPFLQIPVSGWHDAVGADAIASHRPTGRRAP